MGTAFGVDKAHREKQIFRWRTIAVRSGTRRVALCFRALLWLQAATSDPCKQAAEPPAGLAVCVRLALPVQHKCTQTAALIHT